MGTQLSLKGAQPLQFSAHVRCGETDGWIKMPLGMEVGLDPGDFVLDGNPDPSKRGIAFPNFWLTSIVAKQSPISATGALLFRHDFWASSAKCLLLRHQ